MADAGAVAGVAGGAAQALPALVGGGKITRVAQAYKGDPNAGNYGGYEQGLQDRRRELAISQMGADNESARYNDQNKALTNMGVSSLNDANAARGNQLDAMAMAHARATGQAPSIAGMQAQRDMQSAVAAQSSAAASARGPAALALAQQNAAGNTANAQSAISNSAQINSAQERLAAEAAYAGQAAGIRGGDVNQAGQAFGAAGQAGNLGVGMANVAQGYANLENQAIANAGQQKTTTEGQKSQAQGQVEGQEMAKEAQNAQSKGFIEKVGDFFSDVTAKVPVSLGKGGGAMLSDFMGKQLPGPQQSLPGPQRMLPGPQRMLPGPQRTLPGPQAPGMMLSDFTGKVGPVQLGGASAINGMSGMGGGSGAVATPTFDKLTNGGGGMDVMGSLEAHSAFGTQYATDATGGMSSGLTLSDFTGKSAVSDAEAARLSSWADGEIGRVNGTAPTPSLGKGGTKAKGGTWGGSATMTPDELGKWADAELKKTREKQARELAAGPAIKPPDAGAQWLAARAGDDEKAYAKLEEDTAVDAKLAGQATPSGDRNDPAVGLERVARERAARGGKVAPKVSAEVGDPDKGYAPGTADDQNSRPIAEKDRWFQEQEDSPANAPKSDGEIAKQPAWQSAISAFAKSSEQGDAARNGGTGYGRNLGLYMTSDENAKEPAGRAGVPPPSRSPMADANRSFIATPYAYKPGLGPKDQALGEANVGPMAQNLEANPVASTAVKRDPGTGLLAIDRDKALKLALGGIADLQRQQDETRLELGKGGSRQLPGPQRRLPGPQRGGGMLSDFTGKTAMVNTTAGMQPLATLQQAESENPGTMYMMTGDSFDENGVSKFSGRKAGQTTDELDDTEALQRND